MADVDTTQAAYITNPEALIGASSGKRGLELIEKIYVFFSGYVCNCVVAIFRIPNVS